MVGEEESFRGLGRVAGTGWQSARIDRSNFVRAWNKGVVEPIADRRALAQSRRPHRIQIQPQFQRVIGTGAGDNGGVQTVLRRASGSPSVGGRGPLFNPLEPPRPRLLIRSIGTRATLSRRDGSRVRSSCSLRNPSRKTRKGISRRKETENCLWKLMTHEKPTLS